MIIRSDFAITRLVTLPFGALLALYLVVVGGGGAWLYHQVRTVETRLVINEVTAALAPLAKKLGAVDAVAAMQRGEPWLVDDLQTLFTVIPSLRNVSLRDADAGFQMVMDASGEVASRSISPLPAGSGRAKTDWHAAQRLHTESDAMFLIRFDLSRAPAPLVRLDFGLDRAILLARVNEGVAIIKRSAIAFVAVGTVSILLAVVITVVAMRVTRRMEMHFQEIYQRASMTEMAAALVHDLRNPLAALRANVKALLVTPEQAREIADELDLDIVSLNDKLSAFLNLTRRHDDDLEPVDIRELVADAARLAEPVLSKSGLSIEMDIQPDLSQVMVRKVSVRDALLNVLINAAQSGQTAGAVRVIAGSGGDTVRVVIEDQGQGIPEQHLPRLFDAFYTTREDGNGLGLAIVKQVVAAHQGQVFVENRPQGGTRVVLTLPLQPKEIPGWWKKRKKTSRA